MTLLQTALRSSGAALIERDGLVSVVPLADAAVGAPFGSSAASLGFSIRTFALQNVSAAEMAKIVQPFLPADRLVKPDPVRPVLTVSGTPQELSTVAQLIETFDVDWMRGLSFAIFPLQSAKASAVVKELETISGGTVSGGTTSGGTGRPSAGTERDSGGTQQLGMVRFMPIDRLNAVLAITPRPKHLATVRRWITALDRDQGGDKSHLYVYYPQNSRAESLAASLGEIFSGGRGRSGPDFNVAPGQNGGDLSSGGGFGSSGPGGYGSQFGNGSGNLGGGYGGGPGYGNGNGGYGGSAFGRGISGPSWVRPELLHSAADTTPAPTPQPGARSENPLLGGLEPGNASELPTKSGVRVIANREKNAVIILANPDDYQMVEQAIQRLDTAPLQVMIEAMVAEVTLSDRLSYGLEWFFKGGSSTITLSDAATGAVAPAAGFSYLLSSSKAQVVINALSHVTRVDVVASPQLLVLDNQPARLQVGDEVPVATASAVQTVTSTAPLVNSIAYRNTGVILEVRPRVNSSGTVFLDVSQEVSQVAPTSSSTLDSPTIQQRRLRSTIAVTDGQTVALGGLIRDNRSRGRSGLPVLSAIPIIGALFSNRTTGADRPSC